MESIKSLKVRRTLHQALSLGMIVTSALIIWKGLMCITGTESPVVVVLSESMEPGFRRGDILFLRMSRDPIRVGEIVVYNVDGRDIPIVHRVIKIHERRDTGKVDILTKGDNNKYDDISFYAGQPWLQRHHIIGRAVGTQKNCSSKSAMASSSKKRARMISAIASCIYFLVIILQVPLFRYPCRIGMCKSPIEVALSQLIASKVFPDVALKAFLYPGAIAKAIISNTAIPSYKDLLNFFKFSHMNGASAATDLKHLEVLAGSYLCVAGALLGLIKPGRASLFGILLVLCGITHELVLQKHVATKDLSKAVSIYPTVWIPVLSAFFSVRGDVRKLIRSCKGKRIAKQLRRYSKAKFK